MIKTRQRVTSDVLTDVERYWDRLRDGALAPQRDLLDPRRLGKALDHTFILERARSGDIRFRLAGPALTLRAGFDLRTMPARTLIAPGSRDRFETALRDLMAVPKILEMTLYDPVRASASANSRMVFLPMRGGDGAVTRILGALSASAHCSRRPQRWDVADIVPRAIHTPRVAPEPRRAPGFQEQSTPFHPKASLERPYLRLVRDSD